MPPQAHVVRLLPQRFLVDVGKSVQTPVRSGLHFGGHVGADQAEGWRPQPPEEVYVGHPCEAPHPPLGSVLTTQWSTTSFCQPRAARSSAFSIREPAKGIPRSRVLAHNCACLTDAIPVGCRTASPICGHKPPIFVYGRERWPPAALYARLPCGYPCGPAIPLPGAVLLAAGARGLFWRLHRWRRAATPPQPCAPPSRRLLLLCLCRVVTSELIYLQNHSEDNNRLTFKRNRDFLLFLITSSFC